MLLMLSILIIASACSFLSVSSSDKAETTVYDYLQNKYPGLEFEIKSYTQDTYTSGRYVYNILCKTTNVDFTLYHSSFLTTDSYSVVCANSSMEKSLRALFLDEFNSQYVKTVQWMNFYAEGSDGYRFRDVSVAKVPYPTSDVTEIYRFTLKDNSFETEAELVQVMKEAISEFENEGIVLEKITFQFVFGKDTILLTTDTSTVQLSTEEKLEALLVHIGVTQGTNELVEVVYGSNLKKVEYFLKNNDDQFLEESDSDKETTETESTEMQQQTEAALRSENEMQ